MTGLNGYQQPGAPAQVCEVLGGAGVVSGDVSNVVVRCHRRVEALTCADDMTCVLLAGGLAKCWGFNGAQGQLGIGATDSRGDGPGEMGDALPAVDVGTGRAVLSLSTQDSHVCAVLDNAAVKCWGLNNGQLGLGNGANHGAFPATMGDGLPAVDLGSGRTARDVSVGGRHSCAVLDNGALKCWGDGTDGQLGFVEGVNDVRGDEANEMGNFLPTVDFGTSGEVGGVALGTEHSCAIIPAGLKCFGAGSSGRLGLGTGNNLHDPSGTAPIALGAGRSPIHVATGLDHTCAVLDDGSVKCWGAAAAGQLGLGDTSSRGDNAGEMGDVLPAVALGTSVSAIAVAAGQEMTCALLAGGGVKCWGDNSAGQLGLGDTVRRGDNAGEMGDLLPFVALGTGATATSICAGGRHACAIVAGGRVKCWGEGITLGAGDLENRGDEPNEMGDALPFVDLGP